MTNSNYERRTKALKLRRNTFLQPTPWGNCLHQVRRKTDDPKQVFAHQLHVLESIVNNRASGTRAYKWSQSKKEEKTNEKFVLINTKKTDTKTEAPNFKIHLSISTVSHSIKKGISLIHIKKKQNKFESIRKKTSFLSCSSVRHQHTRFSKAS